MASFGGPGQPLRQMEIGNVINMTFKAFRTYPGLILGGTFLLGGIPQGIIAYLQDAAPVLFPDFGRQFFGSTPDWGLIFGAMAVVLLVMIPLFLLLQGVVTRATIAAIDGEQVTFGDCIGVAFRRMPSLLGLFIVAGLAIGLASLLLVVPGIILMVIWYVATPAVIIEGAGSAESLGRSAELTRGSRWWVFLTMIVAGIVSYMIGSIAGFVKIIPMISTISSGGDLQAAAAAFAPITAVVTGLAATVTTALGMIVTTALYAELRDRLEGMVPNKLEDVFA